MSDKNRGQAAGDDLDDALDAALAKYAAVAPREGLQDRIRATLRANQQQAPANAWWKWGLAAAMAMIAFIAIALAFRSPKPSQPVLVKRAPAQGLPDAESNSAYGKASAAKQRPPVRPTQAHKTAPAIVAATDPPPKLDQFPSPQPLTEQEKMLLGYIEQDRDRAVLMAEARMASLRQDEEERRRIETEDQRNSQ